MQEPPGEEPREGKGQWDSIQMGNMSWKGAPNRTWWLNGIRCVAGRRERERGAPEDGARRIEPEKKLDRLSRKLEILGLGEKWDLDMETGEAP